MWEKLVACKCGKRWRLRRVHVPMRDSDSLHCSRGRELISWNGACMWNRAELLEKKKKSK